MALYSRSSRKRIKNKNQLRETAECLFDNFTDFALMVMHENAICFKILIE